MAFRIIPGEGPTPSRLCIIGSHPGREEERMGRPFVGITGRELDQYLSHVGLRRADIFLTNLVKERPMSDKDIPDSLITRWAPELIRELERVQPDYILACSSLVTEWITAGTEYEGMGLEMLHGLTLWHPGLQCFVIPSYHPASGLHESRAMLNVLRDVEAFARAIEGAHNTPQDEYPEPVYKHARHPGEVGWLHRVPLIGLDTEGTKHAPWSVQVSGRPGTATLVLAESTAAVAMISRIVGITKSPVYVHNSLHDRAVCRALNLTLPEYPRTVDTMVVAYQLCDEPQGLKTLAWRHCGMRMQEYSEVVAPAQQQMSLNYLEAAHAIDWGAPEPIKVFKNGVWKDSTPWSINRRLEKMIADYRGVKPTELRAWFGTDAYPAGEVQESPVDLYARWAGVGKRKDPLTGAEIVDEEQQEAAAGVRERVEGELGPMPQATLADVPFEKALYYGCRDADAQARVSPILMRKHAEVLGGKE